MRQRHIAVLTCRRNARPASGAVSNAASLNETLTQVIYCVSVTIKLRRDVSNVDARCKQYECLNFLVFSKSMHLVNESDLKSKVILILCKRSPYSRPGIIANTTYLLCVKIVEMLLPSRCQLLKMEENGEYDPLFSLRRYSSARNSKIGLCSSTQICPGCT
jgi:hypothetical protein